MKRHVIYISGLGDGYDVVRKAGLFFWRRPGVAITHVPMHWMDQDETCEQKLKRIECALEKRKGYETVLVGESAGGAMAIVAMRRYGRKVNRTVTICGMNQGAGNVRSALYRKNRAFREVMNQVDTVVPNLTPQEKRALLTIYSSIDFTVRPNNTLLAGVKAYDLKVPGHMVAIAVVLFWRHSLITKLI